MIIDFSFLLTYYKSLLAKQYRTKTKAQQTIEMMVNCAYCDGVFQDLTTSFNLDTAIGDPLTIIGKIVGVPRTINGLNLSRTYFNFTRYATGHASTGYARYATPDTGVIPLFARYSDYASYTLTDEEMRTLIRLKIILNSSISSLKAIVSSCWTAFGSLVQIVDNLNMTITYNVKASMTNALAAALYLGYLPKPLGVQAIVNYV